MPLSFTEFISLKPPTDSNLVTIRSSEITYDKGGYHPGPGDKLSIRLRHRDALLHHFATSISHRGYRRRRPICRSGRTHRPLALMRAYVAITPTAQEPLSAHPSNTGSMSFNMVIPSPGSLMGLRRLAASPVFETPTTVSILKGREDSIRLWATDNAKDCVKGVSTSTGLLPRFPHRLSRLLTTYYLSESHAVPPDQQLFLSGRHLPPPTVHSITSVVHQ
jgi:hypothetical protein